MSRRPTNPPPQPVRIQLGHAGGGLWVALAVDRHGTGIELVAGSQHAVLLAVRTRWRGVPVDRLPFALEDQTTNGHRLNPAGEAVRAELAHAGQARWCAIVLDGHGAAIEVIWGTKAQVLATIRERWPDLPVREVPHVRENPPGKRGRKEAGAVTDRCHRLRANADPPPGPRICAWCGSTRGIEVAHISGHEEDGTPGNLAWSCRSCNVTVGNVLRRVGLGRATVQFNPAAKGAESLAGWLTAVMSMRGASNDMPVAKAVAVIRATDPATRSAFAHQIWRLRRARYGPTGRPAAPPF